MAVISNFTQSRSFYKFAHADAIVDILVTREGKIKRASAKIKRQEL